MRALACLALLVPIAAAAQERAHTRELLGTMGGRAALMVLQATQRADGGWQVAGEYILLPTLARRFVEGERSPELGITTLKEGTGPILFGRPPTGELRGAWRGARFIGTRFGPAGQERERFDLSEDFASMEAYSAGVRCDVAEGRYSASLAYQLEAGTLRALEWRSQLAPAQHSCAVTAAEQRPMRGGVRAVAGNCTITFRDLGDYVRVAAEGCSDVCGSQAYLEPMLVDRRGNCRVLRPEAR